MKTIRFQNGELADSLAIYRFSQSVFSDYSLPEVLWSLCTQMKDSTFTVQDVAEFLEIEVKQAQNLLNHLISNGVCTSNIECISYDEWKNRVPETEAVSVILKTEPAQIHSHQSTNQLINSTPKVSKNPQLQPANSDFDIKEEEAEEVISLQLV